MNARAGMVALLVTALGCASESGDQGPDADVSAVDTLVAEQLAVIGLVDGPPEYLFGDVTSVAMGPGSIVYVADRIGSSVRAFRTDGEFLGTVASEGQGPGELEWPNDLTFDPRGRLYVRDAYRITVFAPPSAGAVADSVVRTIGLSGYANLSSTRAHTDGTRFYYPAYLFRDGEPSRYFYLVYDSTGVTGDTVIVPPVPNLERLRSARFRVSARSGRMVEGVNRAPFEPFASWDITPDGRLFTSPGERYEVVEWTPGGDTARVIRVDMSPRTVPPAELRDSARAFRERLDSLPVPLEDMLGMSEAARSGTLPDVLPEVLALHTASDGRLWLRRWPGLGDETVFDVLEPRLGLTRHVVVSANLVLDPPPYVSPEFVVGVVRDQITEVERVAVFGVGGR